MFNYGEGLMAYSEYEDEDSYDYIRETRDRLRKDDREMSREEYEVMLMGFHVKSRVSAIQLTDYDLMLIGKK